MKCPDSIVLSVCYTLGPGRFLSTMPECQTEPNRKSQEALILFALLYLPTAVHMTPNIPLRNLKLPFAGDTSPNRKAAGLILSQGSLGLSKDDLNVQIFSLFGFTNLLIPISPLVTTTMSEEGKNEEKSFRGFDSEVPRIINDDFFFSWAFTTVF